MAFLDCLTFPPCGWGAQHKPAFIIMAKGNMLLGYARGKVGDLVFTRRNGEQVTRPRVRVVNNPKTEGQQIQRMIFASVIAAYSRMKSICDHSFEGVKYGADSQAKFMSENLKRLRAFYPSSGNPDVQPYQDMAFALPDNRAAAGTGLIVARGSLPAPEVVATNGVFVGWGTGNLSAQPTIAEMLNAIGAAVGDQITVVALHEVGSSYVFRKSRYVINADATTEQLAANWVGNGSAAAFDQDKTKVSDDIQLGFSNGYALPTAANDDAIAAAIIISRRDADKWLRSDAVLVNMLDEGAQYSAQYALPYWQFSGTDIVTDDPHYLNNADI